jgi:hypothetical protein
MADKATRTRTPGYSPYVTNGKDVTMMMMDGGCKNTRLETSDGYGDLHQGRMEDDEDGGSLMPSATGTLDRKTSQASPATCFQPNRATNKDKACRCQDADANDGWMRRMMMRTAARQWNLLDDNR